MDELYARTATLTLQPASEEAAHSDRATAAAACSSAAASTAQSASADAATTVLTLHVVDLSAHSDDAPIDLSTAAPNYLRVDLDEQGAASVGQVKQRIASARAHKRQRQPADTSLDTPDDEPSLEVAQMRLVYLTQRVPAPAAAASAATSASASASPAPAPAACTSSTCRPLTDLVVATKTLLEYGVASHSWLLLKRKFVRQRSHSEEEEEEGEEGGDEYADDGEEEQYYEEAESTDDAAAGAHEQPAAEGSPAVQ